MKIKIICGLIAIGAGIAWTHHRKSNLGGKQSRSRAAAARGVASVPAPPIAPAPEDVANSTSPAVQVNATNVRATTTTADARPPAALVNRFKADGEAAISDGRLLPEELDQYVDDRLGGWRVAQDEMKENLTQDDFIETQASAE